MSHDRGKAGTRDGKGLVRRGGFVGDQAHKVRYINDRKADRT